MPLNQAGYELTLNQLTDATDGVNYVAIYTNIGLYGQTYSSGDPSYDPLAVTFASASGNEYGASVAASNLPATFSIPAGQTVQAIGLFHNSTLVGFIDVEDVTDANIFQYSVDTITINISGN